MANSKGRRKVRRERTRLGLPPLPQVERKSHIETHATGRGIWKKIPAWAYFIVVAASVGITLVEGYPWLSVEKDELLDPGNPYSQTFVVVNGGYIPVTDLDADCTPDFVTSAESGMGGISVKSLKFADSIPHDGRATISCSGLQLKFPGLLLERFQTPDQDKLFVMVSLPLAATIAGISFHINWRLDGPSALDVPALSRRDN